jgi:photosystem II stability/assembly factor-like uncharacterized protein
MQNLIVKSLVLIYAAYVGNLAYSQEKNIGERLGQRPAAKMASPSSNAILGAARAGKRIVAVGDRGVVLLSDDNGATFRQADAVPTRATLTSVSFADERHGWAVGHWGVILSTENAGETWKLKRADATVDQPFFSVAFTDKLNGLAVGLFALALSTNDGGKTWNTVALPAMSGTRSSDVNLLSTFPDRRGGFFIAGENGLVFHQAKSGEPWAVISTGARGTLWAGLSLDSGQLLVGGLRGTLYRSADDGKSWLAVDSKTKSSITGFVELPGGQIVASTMDGSILVSDDRGVTFTSKRSNTQGAMTALTSNADGAPVIFSAGGVFVYQ